MAARTRAERAQRALTPLTREYLCESGEVVREFDVRSAATVLSAFIGSIFLIFFLLAFIPWLLANGMTEAVEGMMQQIGFTDFEANHLGDWMLVLVVGAVFTGFIVAVAVAILALYNVISKRTNMGLRVMTELPAAEAPVALEPPAPVETTPIETTPIETTTVETQPAKTTKAASKKSTSKRTTKRSASSRRS